MKQSIISKLFLNKYNEISLTKIGLIITTISGVMLLNPGIAILVTIGKVIAPIGVAATTLGAMSKKERNADVE